jgi:hypothetical protein
MRALLALLVPSLAIAQATVAGGASAFGGAFVLGSATPIPITVSATASPTQAILLYARPGMNPCSIAISPSPNMLALVADSDPALFSGASADNRAGSLLNGSAVMFVSGRHTTSVALNGRRYSRSLTPSTPYYYQVSCESGRYLASGSFTTAPLPSGNTYPDPPKSDLAMPGVMDWPTTDTSTTSLTDPRSGVSMTPLLFGLGNGWPSGSGTTFCANSPVTSSDSKTGYLCIVSDDTRVWFIDNADQIVRQIGTLTTIFGTLPGDSSGDFFDAQPIADNNSYYVAPKTFLVEVYTESGFPVILSGLYSGGYQTGDLALTWTNLTPHGSGSDTLVRMNAFDARFNTSLFNHARSIGISPNGNIMIQFQESPVTQGTIGWLGVFNSAGTVIAAIPSWLAPIDRWCAIHSQGIYSDDTSHAALLPANGRYRAGWPLDFGGNGDGPWISNVTAGSLTATPTYNVGQAIPGFTSLTCNAAAAGGLTIQGCDVITVAGQPCDPTIGSGETNNCAQTGLSGFHLMDWALQDRVMAQTSPATCGNGVCENMIIIGIVDNGDGTFNIALGRGGPDQGACFLSCPGLVQNHGSAGGTLTAIGAVCSCNFLTDNSPMIWDYVMDIHGSGSNLVADVHDMPHAASTPSGEFGTATFNLCPAGTGLDCTGVKLGANFSWVATTPSHTVPASPAFAGVNTLSLNTDQYVEIYTGTPPTNPTVANPQFFPSARPIESLPATWNTTATSNVYNVTGVGAINPKVSELLSSCGGYPMVDVSSATQPMSGPLAALTTANTYCLANSAGECYAGSASGSIYANCASAVGDSTQTFLSRSSATPAMVSSIRYDSAAQSGVTILPLTGCGRLLSRQTSFWSARIMPDGVAGFCFADSVAGSGSSAVLLFRFPPLPSFDRTDRTNYVPVTISIPANAGLSAYIQFGYMENGPVTSYFCQSRQEACIANAATVGATPFSWASENPTFMPCASGCKIQIPGIAERMLYYQVKYSDNSTMPEAVTEVLGQGGAQISGGILSGAVLSAASP